MMKINHRQLKSKVGINICIILVILVTNFVFATNQLSAQGKRIGLADLAELVRLSDPRISPDGKQIVFAVSRQNLLVFSSGNLTVFNFSIKASVFCLIQDAET